MRASPSATSRSAGRSRDDLLPIAADALPRCARDRAWTGRRRPSSGTGWPRTIRAAARAAAIDAAAASPAPGMPPPTSWPRSSSRCRCRSVPRTGGPASPPVAQPSDLVDLAGPRLGGGVRGRPDVAGDELPRSGDRRARRPTRPRPARACSTSAWAVIRRAAGDPAGAMLAARRAVELVPREPSPGTGDGPRRRSPSSRCSTASSPMRSGSPGRRSGSRGPATRRPTPGGPCHDDARGRARLGQRSERRDRPPPRGRGRPRPRSTIPTRCSGSGPT